MQLKLELKEKNVNLVLLDGDKSLDRENWIDENNLLEKFFPICDELLTRNDVVIGDVDDFVLDTNVPDGYTTARIAQTIVQTLNFAQKT